MNVIFITNLKQNCCFRYNFIIEVTIYSMKNKGVLETEYTNTIFCFYIGISCLKFYL